MEAGTYTTSILHFCDEPKTALKSKLINYVSNHVNLLFVSLLNSFENE